jgi:hypothetical protein
VIWAFEKVGQKTYMGFEKVCLAIGYTGNHSTEK